jgi:hypothetical protein
VEQPVDTWEPRSGVALALAQIAPLLTPKSVSNLITFFVSVGLGDRSPEVRKNMLAAALAAVDLHGKVRRETYFCHLHCSYQSDRDVSTSLYLGLSAERPCGSVCTFPRSLH